MRLEVVTIRGKHGVQLPVKEISEPVLLGLVTLSHQDEKLVAVLTLELLAQLLRLGEILR